MPAEGRRKLDEARGAKRLQPLEQARFPGQRTEQLTRLANAFSLAQHQQAVFAQAVVKQRDELALQLGVEVDQEVSAQQDVELRERRVHCDVLRCEYELLAQTLLDLITKVVMDEKALQSLSRHAVGNVVRIPC